jgi:hypothetical protein
MLWETMLRRWLAQQSGAAFGEGLDRLDLPRDSFAIGATISVRRVPAVGDRAVRPRDAAKFPDSLVGFGESSTALGRE